MFLNRVFFIVFNYCEEKVLKNSSFVRGPLTQSEKKKNNANQCCFFVWQQNMWIRKFNIFTILPTTPIGARVRTVAYATVNRWKSLCRYHLVNRENRSANLNELNARTHSFVHNITSDYRMSVSVFVDRSGSKVDQWINSIQTQNHSEARWFGSRRNYHIRCLWPSFAHCYLDCWKVFIFFFIVLLWQRKMKLL